MNKLSNLVYFSIICMFLLHSCKGDNSKGVGTKVEEKVYNEYTENRDQAAAVIEFRKKEEPNALAFLVTGFWEYDVIFKKTMSEAGDHKGEWLKFEDDFTYTYGKYGKQNGSGKYHHGLKTQRLVLLDDDTNKPPFEYELKTSNAFMILVGRNTYGNNAVQMKLLKVDQKPSK